MSTTKTTPLLTHTLGVDGGEVASQDAITGLLAAARTQLGMDVAFVSEWDDGRQVFRFLDGDTDAFGLQVDQGTPLDGSYCRRVVDGSLPRVIPDAQQDPRTRDLDVTTALGIGAYVGTPLTFRDGRVFGMLCGLRQQADPSLRDRDAQFLDVFATAIASQLERREEQRAVGRAREERIRAALVPGAVLMVFQPVVALDTGRVVGAEALARFQLEPRRGPDVWFAEAWEAGHGVELELTAVRAALSGLDALPSETFLAVNLAPQTLLSPALGEVFQGVPHGRLVLELTEHARVDDYAALEAALAPLRARGARLAIDDAGAGFASLQHILRLRPDFIKLDLGLTRGVDVDPAKRALAAALVVFGREVGATILAEGIETRDELVALRRLGVTLGQGYHLARPGPLPLPDSVEVGAKATPSRRAPSAQGPEPSFGSDPRAMLHDPARLAAVHASGLLDSPPEEVFDRLARIAAELLNVPVALVSVLDERRQFIKSAVGLAEPWASRREIPLSYSFCRHAVATGAPLLVEDARTHALLHDSPAIQEFDARAYAGIPLLTSDHLALGTLCVLASQPRVWAAQEIAFLQVLAAAAVTEIELRAAARRAEDARQALGVANAALRHTLTELAEDEDRFHRLADATFEGIFVSEGGVIVEVNRAAAAMFGYTPEELVGRTATELIAPGERDTVGTVLRTRAEGEYETVGLRHDGTPFPIAVRGRTITLRGRVARVSAVEDVTARRHAEAEIARQAEELRALSLVDELTGLYNRRGFLTLAYQAFKIAQAEGRQVALIFADLDGLKGINDRLGHHAGDQALLGTAAVLRETFRAADVVARLGGDEFVVLATVSEVADAATFVERLQANVTAHNARSELSFMLALSTGVTFYEPSQPESIEVLLERADARMYEQKRQKKAARSRPSFLPRPSALPRTVEAESSPSGEA